MWALKFHCREIGGVMKPIQSEGGGFLSLGEGVKANMRVKR